MRRIGAVLGLVLCPLLALAQELTLLTERASCVYRPGETVVFRLTAKDTGGQKVRFSLKRGGSTVLREGEAELRDGAALLETALDAPGAVLAEARVKGADGKDVRALAGALVEPAKIVLALPCPDDFDAFWKARIGDLAAVPANPVLAGGDAGRDGVEYFTITMDNIRGTKIRGQLARPKEGAKLPALLIVQWAGVYPLEKGWATGPAAEGFLTLNILAHDLPIDEPKEFYKAQADGPLKDYAAAGNDSRETSYFLRMYLSCYRAAEYLARRPDWDGRTLIVSGTSQGGMQTFVTAGLHPKITAAMAMVPAGCDLAGHLAGRSPGWPQWNRKTEGKDPAKVLEACRYYDAANFAARITCPILVGAGLVDETCPPEGVVAALNQCRGPKELVILPRSDHQGRGNSQAPYHARAAEWRAAIKAGRAPEAAGIR